jgi:GNAT superfamily N-acetyltransferase
MGIEVRLRPAREDEREALGALKLRASLAWGDFTDALKALPEAGELAPELLPSSFVAEVGGGPAGFATVVVTDSGAAELEELFVEPALWRKGVGRRLVEEAVRRAAAAGAATIHVVASRRARGFYEACGFEVAGEVETRFEPALSMQRRVERG